MRFVLDCAQSQMASFILKARPESIAGVLPLTDGFLETCAGTKVGTLRICEASRDTKPAT